MAYNAKKDEYVCPDGRKLKFRRERDSEPTRAQLYQFFYLSFGARTGVISKQALKFAGFFIVLLCSAIQKAPTRLGGGFNLS
jgi:hypothetical protein